MFGNTKKIPTKEIDQRFAIVTGASSGLGEAIILNLLENDYIVFGLSRSGLDLDDENYFDFECDVRSEEQVEKVFAEIETQTESIDLLVNNAGICEMAPVGETGSLEFRAHLETNTLGTFHLLKHFENYILEGQSHIINILSTAANNVYVNASAYVASKFAMKGLIETTEKEWTKYNVKFSNLYPGAIDTPLWDKLDIEFSRARMLTIQEFMYVFNMVAHGPQNLRVSDITFLHREGAK